MNDADLPAMGTYIQSAVGSYNAQANNGSTAMIFVFQSAAPQTVDANEVADAEALLATMPVGEVPEHSGLPRLHTVPWSLNRYFVGRTSELLALADQLKNGGPTATGQSPVIIGLGGQGKTQLAVEFAYRFGSWFPGGVFWLNLSDPALVPLAIAACGPILYPTDTGFRLRPLLEQVALVSSAWMSPLPRLLIFDNCENETLLDSWAPKGGGCRLLITSRRASWSSSRGITKSPLVQLSRSESVALLQKHRRDLELDSSGLDAIANELGDFPLALELAGSYLTRYQNEEFGAPEAYLDELRSANILTHISLAANGSQASECDKTMTGHEKNVARTFEVSLRRLQIDNSTDTLARELFLRIAWLAPGEPIPRHLLKMCAGIAEDDTTGRYRFADALDRLINLALIEAASQGRGTVVVHRLLAAFARLQGRHAEIARHKIEYTLATESDRLVRESETLMLGSWEPHLTAVAIAAQEHESEAHVSLINAAASYNTLIGNYEASRDMLLNTIRDVEVKIGPGAYQLASLYGNLGIVYSELGKLSCAEAAHRTQLSIVTQAPGGPYDFEVAQIYNNLGNVQFLNGDFVDAEGSFNQSLKIKCKMVPPSSREIGVTLSNLGAAQLKLGKSLIAMRTLERALAMKVEAFGSDHLEVALTKTNLGVTYYAHGHLTRADIYQTEALAVYEKYMGRNHLKVAGILCNRGAVRYALGKLREAQSDYARSVSIYRAKLDDEYPRIRDLLQWLRMIDKQLESKNDV